MGWLILFVAVLAFAASCSAYASGVVTRLLLVLSVAWMALYFWSDFPDPPHSMAGFIGPPLVLWVAVILLRWIFSPLRPPYLGPTRWPE